MRLLPNSSKAHLPLTRPDVKPNRSSDRRPGPSPWITAFALPVVVPLGVVLPIAALPNSAYAQTAINGNYGTTVNLATYPTGNPFTIEQGANIIVTSGTALSGPGGTFWTLTNLVTIVGGRGIDLVSGSVTNSGIATGTADYGVNLSSGSVTNTGAALISGNYDGVRVTTGAGTVTNHGTIQGTSASSVGVNLQGGGSVSNLGTASTISGGETGVQVGVGSAGGVVLNEGTITGTTSVEGIVCSLDTELANGCRRFRKSCRNVRSWPAAPVQLQLLKPTSEKTGTSSPTAAMADDVMMKIV